jgi:phosphatidylglycerophosphate synthase
MFDLYMRFFLVHISAPFVHTAGKIFTPNQLTFIGFLLGLVCSYALSLGYFTTGFVLWMLNRFLDMLDGAVARYTGQQSDFGGYFDIVLDFTVYSCIPFSLASYHGDLRSFRWLSLMFSAFFINCVSQFYLAGLLEKRQAGVSSTQAKANQEFTSLTMPPAVRPK